MGQNALMVFLIGRFGVYQGMPGTPILPVLDAAIPPNFLFEFFVGS